MGFLQRFFRNVFRDASPPMSNSSFEHLSEEQLEAHLGIGRYGAFALTDAVRPSYDLQVVPKEGYRHDMYRDPENRSSVPVLMVAASRENLFELFMDLLEPLGCEVDVVLETSHHRDNRGHVDLYREHIDLPVLKSTLYDYEDLLLNDGCTGVAVLATGRPVEVQFDEHKLLHVYAPDLKPFRRALRALGVRRRRVLPLISEAEHLHHTTDDHADAFRQLCLRVGVGDFDRVFSDENG
jgi:hypothetical protein